MSRSQQIAVAILVSVIEGKIADERAQALADVEAWTISAFSASQQYLKADVAAMLATRENREALELARWEAKVHEGHCFEIAENYAEKARAYGASEAEVNAASLEGMRRWQRGMARLRAEGIA